MNKIGKSYRTNTVDGRGGGWDNEDRPGESEKGEKLMEKGRGKGTYTLQTDNVFTRKEYIKREAAIDALQNHYEVRNAVQNGIMDECVMLMMRVPAADVVPVRHGVWVDPRWKSSLHYMNCNQCGGEVQHQVYHGTEKYYRHCPFCGARMDMGTDCTPVKDGDGDVS